MQIQQDEIRDHAAEPPVRLRGHHLLCLLTFRGLGYTPAFVENMGMIAAAIANGRSVALVDGPDDICNALSPDDRIACNHDCARTETRALDDLAIAGVMPLIGEDPHATFVLTKDMTMRLRKAFSEGGIREACARCRWKAICDTMAEDGYPGAAFYPEQTAI